MRMQGLMQLALLPLLLTGCPATSPAASPAAPNATVSLTWSGGADLDLELWSDTGLYLGDANDWHEQADGQNQEEFAFRAYNAEEDLRGGKGAHFEQGSYVIAVTAWSANQPCTATLTVRGAEGEAQTITSEPIAQNSVWYAMRWDNNAKKAAIIDTIGLIPLLAAR